MMPESKGVARISKTEEIENPELVSVLSKLLFASYCKCISFEDVICSLNWYLRFI